MWKLNKCAKFTPDQILEMEQEFLLLRKITIDDFDSYTKAEATIRVDKNQWGRNFLNQCFMVLLI